MKKYFLSLFLITSFLSVFAQKEDTILIKNGILSYRVFGEGEPLLFLNGGPGFASNGYETYANILSKKRKVILFDQRGTGKSTLDKINSRTVNMKKMVEDIEVLRKELKIEQWDVMGNSFGGLYAMAYANKYPSHIKSMILSSTVGIDFESFKAIPKIPPVDTSVMMPIEKQMLQEYKAIKQTEENAKKRKHLQVGLIGRHYVHKNENTLKAIDWFVNKADISPKISKLVNSSIENYNFKRKLKNFNQPVLIIHGRADFIPIGIHKATLETLPNSKLIAIKECGHMIFFDQPEVFQELLYDFLEKHEGL